MDTTERDVCPLCGDSGEVECETCDGSGADCRYCGRGECDTCGGDGVVKCECVDEALA